MCYVMKVTDYGHGNGYSESFHRKVVSYSWEANSVRDAACYFRVTQASVYLWRRLYPDLRPNGWEYLSWEERERLIEASRLVEKAKEAFEAIPADQRALLGIKGILVY